MPHMQQQITEKMQGWRVETRDAGTCFVPGDVASVPEYLKAGIAIAVDDAGADSVAHAIAALVEPYVEGRDFISVEVCTGYFGRLSAPGYLDCTEWTFGATLRDVRDALKGI